LQVSLVYIQTYHLSSPTNITKWTPCINQNLRFVNLLPSFIMFLSLYYWLCLPACLPVCC
jgi:hypothetical protein